MRNSIAIIPARGGSKRIPRKNIKLFCGKPIISYPIQMALSSQLFDEIIVSTEDAEIAKISVEYGAKVPFLRSEKNADDNASTASVIIECATQYEKYFSTPLKYICCIYPTASLTSCTEIESGFDLLNNNDCDSVFPVCQYGHPIWRSFRLENNLPIMNWPENQENRTQDLVPTFHDAGQWYWLNWETFKSKKKIFTHNSRVIVLPELSAQDIDNPEDWILAEAKYKIKYAQEDFI